MYRNSISVWGPKVPRQGSFQNFGHHKIILYVYLPHIPKDKKASTDSKQWPNVCRWQSEASPITYECAIIVPIVASWTSSVMNWWDLIILLNAYPFLSVKLIAKNLFVQLVNLFLQPPFHTFAAPNFCFQLLYFSFQTFDLSSLCAYRLLLLTQDKRLQRLRCLFVDMTSHHESLFVAFREDWYDLQIICTQRCDHPDHFFPPARQAHIWLACTFTDAFASCLSRFRSVWLSGVEWLTHYGIEFTPWRQA